jgi:probable rRNA maturation factor
MILNRQRSVRVSKRALELFLQRVGDELGLGEAHVTVCLVSDAEIAGMNKAFRKKEGPTDVLSFPAETSRKNRHGMRRGRIGVTGKRTKSRVGRRDEKFLGDIAIAPGVAKRNAQIYGRTLPVEMKILILHGVLHLLGYDHETDSGEMERAEQKLRRRLGLA